MLKHINRLSINVLLPILLSTVYYLLCSKILSIMAKPNSSQPRALLLIATILIAGLIIVSINLWKTNSEKNEALKNLRIDCESLRESYALNKKQIEKLVQENAILLKSKDPTQETIVFKKPSAKLTNL